MALSFPGLAWKYFLCCSEYRSLGVMTSRNEPSCQWWLYFRSRSAIEAGLDRMQLRDVYVFNKLQKSVLKIDVSCYHLFLKQRRFVNFPKNIFLLTVLMMTKSPKPWSAVEIMKTPINWIEKSYKYLCVYEFTAGYLCVHSIQFHLQTRNLRKTAEKKLVSQIKSEMRYVGEKKHPASKYTSINHLIINYKSNLLTRKLSNVFKNFTRNELIHTPLSDYIWTIR